MTRTLLLPLLLACGPKQPPASAAAPPVVYALRAADAEIKPAELVSLMHDFYDVRLLISVSGAPGADLRLLLAPATASGSQDLCAETTTWQSAADAGGAFQVQDASLGLSVDGDASRLSAVSASGQLPQAGAPLALGEVAGLLDTRPFLPMMGNNLAPDALCAMLPVLGPCVACPEDGSPTCWSLSLRGAAASPTPGPVVPRSRAEICADAACVDAKLCKAGG